MACHRFLLKYAIVCALWFNPSKPPIQAFLQPLMSQLKELSTNGNMSCLAILTLLTHCSRAGETSKTAEGLQHCKVNLILITCDLPARTKVLCMSSTMDSMPVRIVIIQALLLAVITFIDIGQSNMMLLPEPMPVLLVM